MAAQHAQQQPQNSTVIEQVRDLMPRRPVSLMEAYSVAEHQAYQLLDLLGIHGPHVTYTELLRLPNIEIHLEPDYLLEHISGMSSFSNGHWLIIVDKNDVHGRRRFTLAHEFKHIIDHPLDRLTYARFGYGNGQRRQAHIEAICQHFAACFLMPKTWVKNAYTNGVQDVYDLASLFQVSVSAMDTRLHSIGLLEDPSEEERDVSSYFRQRRGLPLGDVA